MGILSSVSYHVTGIVQDNQTTEKFLHGSGWSCTQSKNEPTKRKEIQVISGNFCALSLRNSCCF